MSDQVDISTILEDFRMSRNIYAAKRRILTLAKTPEEAQKLVAFLASVDWTQAFREQKIPKEVALEEYREEMQKWLLEGGGPCDVCGDEHLRLYAWPHAAHAVSIWEYLTDPKGWHDASDRWDSTYSWCYQRFCKRCFHKLQTDLGVPQESLMDLCDRCGRLMFLIVEYLTTSPQTLTEIPTTPQKTVNRNR